MNAIFTPGKGAKPYLDKIAHQLIESNLLKSFIP